MSNDPTNGYNVKEGNWGNSFEVMIQGVLLHNYQTMKPSEGK